MKILAIGNSFSQDAAYYLHDLARADGTDIEITNLYIGGCSLERHWTNIVEALPDYLMELNGVSTERMVTVQEALATENWDVITVQQASHESGAEESYHPYLENLVAFLREQKPSAKLLMQETWAYETDSIHKGFKRYGCSQQKMYEALKACYEKNAKESGLSLIPCGDVIQELRKKEPFLYNRGGMSVCRDGFHMNVIYGRYLLAAVWYRKLTGRKVSGIPFVPHAEIAPGAVCNEAILKAVQETVDNYSIIPEDFSV